MKYVALVVILIVIAGCTNNPALPTLNSIPTQANSPLVPTRVAQPTYSPYPTPLTSAMSTPAASASEEAEVKNIVEGFGKRLQNVSLLSPQVLEEMRTQYAEFVSSDMLQKWIGDLSQAPGRAVSSPWPDRIEITSMTKTASDQYIVTGHIVEVTSLEVVSGGSGEEIPVHLTVQKLAGRWLITGYGQEDRQQ